MTVEEVEKFIKDNTKINFEISTSSLSGGTTPVTKALDSAMVGCLREIYQTKCIQISPYRILMIK